VISAFALKIMAGEKRRERKRDKEVGIGEYAYVVSGKEKRKKFDKMEQEREVERR
jgi:hypothetical protein